MRPTLASDIQGLLAERTVESHRLAYKSRWNHQTGREVVCTACAFANDLANVNGGYIVVGVREEGGRPVLPPEGVPAELLDRTQKEIQGALRRISPAYHALVHPVSVGDRTVLVVSCPAGDARPYDAPMSLGKGALRQRYVRVGPETKEATGAYERQLLEVSRRVPFDDRACLDARVEDLSPDLFWHHVGQAQSRLGPRAGDARAAYRQWNLLVGTNGHEVPRNVAVLFFAEAPTRWVPGARIEVAQLPYGRAGRNIVEHPFEGPLPGMLSNALDLLRGLLPSRLVKHGDRAEAERVEAYPFAAVEEALVNAVHHRGYDDENPIKVELLPDALRIISYPGPVPGLTAEALETGDLGTAPARNRRIADLLKEVRLAEARGTGIALIRQAMARNGSPPPRFRFDADRTWFEVVLPVHPSFRPERSEGLPLRLGRPAPPDEVVGREPVLALLTRALAHGSALVVGPNGTGKSSVLGAVAAHHPGRVVRLDFTGQTARGLMGALVEWRRGLDGPPADLDPLIAVVDRRETLTLQALAAPFDAPTLLVLDGVDASLMDGPDEEALHDFVVDLFRASPQLTVLAASAWVPCSVDERRDPVPLSARVVSLPPLDERPTEALAARLLRGVGVEPEASLLAALVRCSGGVPHLVHLLVREVYVRGARSEREVDQAFDELLADVGDPTGLRALLERLRRRHAWRVASGSSASPDAATEAFLLDLVAGDARGLPRLDLVGRAVSAGLPRLAVAEAVRRLELEGWLAEADERLRFYHPLLREARPPLPGSAG